MVGKHLHCEFIIFMIATVQNFNSSRIQKKRPSQSACSLIDVKRIKVKKIRRKIKIL